jgi:hypothetical protein
MGVVEGKTDGDGGIRVGVVVAVTEGSTAVWVGDGDTA